MKTNYYLILLGLLMYNLSIAQCVVKKNFESFHFDNTSRLLDFRSVESALKTMYVIDTKDSLVQKRETKRLNRTSNKNFKKIKQ